MMNLKELRKENKKTQEEIAKYLKISPSTYGRYEAENREINIETLKALADYYNVSLDYLVGRKYGNELGFLTEFQYNTIKCFLCLNEQNQAIINGRIMSLLEIQ